MTSFARFVESFTGCKPAIDASIVHAAFAKAVNLVEDGKLTETATCFNDELLACEADADFAAFIQRFLGINELDGAGEDVFVVPYLVVDSDKILPYVSYVAMLLHATGGVHIEGGFPARNRSMDSYPWSPPVILASTGCIGTRATGWHSTPDWPFQNAEILAKDICSRIHSSGSFTAMSQYQIRPRTPGFRAQFLKERLAPMAWSPDIVPEHDKQAKKRKLITLWLAKIEEKAARAKNASCA